MGVFLSGPIADNFGRRLTMLLGLLLGVIGHIIIQFAGNLAVVGVGMYLVGLSVESCYNVIICILS